MPVTPRTEPSYEVTCDRCGTTPAWDDSPTLFATRDEARAWARNDGWQVGDELLCTEDAIDAANQREHDEEIAAAIQYATGPDA